LLRYGGTQAEREAKQPQGPGQQQQQQQQQKGAAGKTQPPSAAGASKAGQLKTNTMMYTAYIFFVIYLFMGVYVHA
jgi:preprotein translocase subunit SecG